MKRKDGQMFRPTKVSDLRFIRENYATMTSGEIEAAIGVRRITVRAIASRLGLKKNDTTLSETRRAARAKREHYPPRQKTPTPLGTHAELLLGLRSVKATGMTGRVYRINDDDNELEAA